MITSRRAPAIFGILSGVLAGLPLLVLMAGRPASGQERSVMGQRAGIVYGGQYFGFDPSRVRHEDVMPAAPAEAETERAPGELLPRDPDARPSQEWLDDEDCGPCCQSSRFWGRGEFLLWWMKGMNLPPLATSTADGSLPDATVAFGGYAVNDGTLPGGRFTLGLWLDDCNQDGIEASYLTLGRANAGFQGSAANFDFLARPFTNVDPANLGAQAMVIVDPDETTGSLTITATSQFTSFDLLWRRNLSRVDCCSTDMLIGYRHSELIDQVHIAQTVTTTATTATPGTSFLLDQFNTRNVFDGAEFGLGLQRRLNECWAVDLTAKGAIGQVHSSLGIAGRTRTNPTGGTSTFTDVGLLAQTTNSGNFGQSDFTAIGDFNLNLRRQLRCGWSASIGYSLIIWGQVMRAGDQIDLNVNTSQIPPDTLTGDPRPLVPFASTTFWAHGLQLGLERAF